MNPLTTPLLRVRRTRRFNSVRALASATVFSALAASPLAGAQPGESYPDFAPDGAWCWFSDPRAVARDGKTYSGWVTTDGSVEVGAHERSSGDTVRHMLHPKFERDDHDNPAFIFLPDGKLAAFYSLHSKGDMRLRVTKRAGDISDWEEERSLGFVDPSRGRRGTTYANPVILSAEQNAFFIFWRGSNFKPTFSVSRDLGATWGPQQTLISRPGADDTNRPYLKLRADGERRIHFVFTDGHPRNETANSVYYVRYEDGAFSRADGTKLGSLADAPLDPSLCDRVYDGATDGRAWIWDISFDATGHPVIAYTRLPAENDHRYHVARWDGTRWVDSEICKAGGWFPQTPEGAREREPHYSGGMSIDGADPFVVYTSRPIDGVFEIEKWTSTDRGATWSGEFVTSRSKNHNVRPFAVRGASPGGPSVLWMNFERYVHFTDYRSSIKADTLGAPPPASE